VSGRKAYVPSPLTSDFKLPVHRPRGRGCVRNEPNLAPRWTTDGENCAKRSQTWGNWGVWEKAVVVWGVARPGSEVRKTNPIRPGRRVNAQNEPNLARPGGEVRKTNPIWPGRRVNAQNEPNFGHRGKMSGGDAQPPIRSGAGSTKSRGVQNEPNFGQPVGLPQRIVQNEANSRRGGWAERQMCKTKPISPERPGMGAG
jgi:hypothetical protein